MAKYSREEVLFQVKRLYALKDLMISGLESKRQRREANFAFSKFMSVLSERFNSPLVNYIFWEDDTVESCTDKVMKNLEKSEDEK